MSSCIFVSKQLLVYEPSSSCLGARRHETEKSIGEPVISRANRGAGRRSGAGCRTGSSVASPS
ncbi:unnamed protein product [Musa acuminata subsp. malaccensis]|uniref:(wild Malaysian banana) hypothetical protein n=1 Tax=Musa acuminata subsp. malaccensis TaxID=214687 RepID=A0A8D7AY15_MUSAM|nr:unnamed protein product [Musa acuminata subsp. malaccensis]